MSCGLPLGVVGSWGVDRVVGGKSVGGVSRGDLRRSGMGFVGVLGCGRLDCGAPSKLGAVALTDGDSAAPSAGVVVGISMGGECARIVVAGDSRVSSRRSSDCDRCSWSGGRLCDSDVHSHNLARSFLEYLC
jgi:hypothetical protein